jgi:hypothetical protein
MPIRRRPRVEPTHEWQQGALLVEGPEQRAYDVMRLCVLNEVQEMIMAQHKPGRSHDDNPWRVWARSRGAVPYPTRGGDVY